MSDRSYWASAGARSARAAAVPQPSAAKKEKAKVGDVTPQWMDQYDSDESVSRNAAAAGATGKRSHDPRSADLVYSQRQDSAHALYNKLGTYQASLVPEVRQKLVHKQDERTQPRSLSLARINLEKGGRTLCDGGCYVA